MAGYKSPSQLIPGGGAVPVTGAVDVQGVAATGDPAPSNPVLVGGQVADMNAPATHPADSIGPLWIDDRGAINRVNAHLALNENADQDLSDVLLIHNASIRLYGITGYNAGNSTIYIQLHDTPAIPSNGDRPFVTFPVLPGEPYSLDYGSIGRVFTFGCCACASTTGPTLTYAGAVAWMDAQFDILG